MSGRTLKSLMRSYGIKYDSANSTGYYARVDDDDWEFCGRNLDEVQDWLAMQGEEVCAEAMFA
jgi:hypothetical protein